MGDPVLTFYGAAGTVTGSCFGVEVAGRLVLVDCGMFQGSKTERELNYRPFPFSPEKVSAVILTHAHIDHSGLVPKLVKHGFAGPVLATRATRDLCSVMLPDSGHIQESEVENLNRRNSRRGRDPVEPIYTADDAVRAVEQIQGLDYGHWHDATDGIRFRFSNAGHLLGSASVEMECATDAGPLRLLFSGDLGPEHKLLQDDPEAGQGFDYVICESTYGDEDRPDKTEQARRAQLKAEVKAAIKPQGVLLIPSFAVERTQELVTDLFILMEEGAIPRIPIVIDSPLAKRATDVFRRHAGELRNGDVVARAFASRDVRFTETVEQSKALDNMREFHIVIAASGMCEAGRIRHRLRNWIWREEATVLLVGYQANGTLGRLLQEGASWVRIQGDDLQVRAAIRMIDLYSGHADGPELAEWVTERSPIRAGVFLVHGEHEAVEGLAARLVPVVGSIPVNRAELDSVWSLGKSGPTRISGPATPPPRIEPERMGRKDWHHDVDNLLMDVQQAVSQAADDKARAVIIRRLRKAMSGERD